MLGRIMSRTPDDGSMRRYHRPITVGLTALTAAVLGGFTISDSQALASHVSCGDTITSDTTLDTDLVDCPSNGIVIGADGITLDLDGHPSAATAHRSRCAPRGSSATSGSSTTATTQSR